MLEYPTERIDYISSTLFKDLIHFIARNKIEIITKKYINIELQKRDDKCIMDEVLQSNLSKSKRIQVNARRLYFRVIYLSDMIEPDGKTIDMNLYSGKRPAYPKSKFTWSNQSNPSSIA